MLFIGQSSRSPQLLVGCRRVACVWVWEYQNSIQTEPWKRPNPIRGMWKCPQTGIRGNKQKTRLQNPTLLPPARLETCLAGYARASVVKYLLSVG